LASTLTLSACGQPDSSLHKADDIAARVNTSYLYANPNSGQETSLRPSSGHKQQEIKDAFDLELTNPSVRVLADQRTIRFQITRVEQGKSEVIAISGTFDDPTHAWLIDEGAVSGKHRVKGLAYCLASTEEQIDCSDMFVNIYFKHKGELISSQFMTDPQSGEHAPAEPGSQAHAEDLCEDTNHGRDSSGGGAMPADDHVPACIPVADSTDGIPVDVSDGEGLGDAAEETTDGEYVAPKPPDHFLDDLIGRTHTSDATRSLTQVG
jgi:hypothetical protein